LTFSFIVLLPSLFLPFFVLLFFFRNSLKTNLNYNELSRSCCFLGSLGLVGWNRSDLVGSRLWCFFDSCCSCPSWC
jgi:hypothetical protein